MDKSFIFHQKTHGSKKTNCHANNVLLNVGQVSQICASRSKLRQHY